jgi:hypothetical protein
VRPNERQIAGYGEYENDGGPDPNGGWLERQRKWLTPEISSQPKGSGSAHEWQGKNEQSIEP